MSKTTLCPFCRARASQPCKHLALAVISPQFIARCVKAARAEDLWERYCRQVRKLQREEGGGELPDFTWIESAFYDEFLKRLEWFGEMTYEWRDAESSYLSGDLWVYLWSKNPPRLWWQLRDKLEQHLAEMEASLESRSTQATFHEEATGSLF